MTDADDWMGEWSQYDPFPQKKPEKSVQLLGKRFDGVQYVRLADVCKLLEANRVLPSIVAKLRPLT